MLAGRAGGLLVPAALAGESGIPRTTLVRYLELLSSVFLIKSIPAWASGQTQRAIGTPKLAFVDTGIASHLIGQNANRMGEPGGTAGPMLENFVAMELARQLTWCDERARLYHYRTKDRLEVDAVLETPDGRIIGVEVKAGPPSVPKTSAACGTWRPWSATASLPVTCSTPGSRPSPWPEDQSHADGRAVVARAMRALVTAPVLAHHCAGVLARRGDHPTQQDQQLDREPGTHEGPGEGTEGVRNHDQLGAVTDRVDRIDNGVGILRQTGAIVLT